MAYTTGQTLAQIITAVQTANPAVGADAITNAMSGLANAQAPNPAIGSPILFAGVLIKCTTGFSGGTPVYAYDSAPA